MTVQATSPYFARDAFLCILKTVQSAGFSVLPYHNHIPTMGEWGWVMGVKSEDMDERRLKTIVQKLQFSDINTLFINQEAMIFMSHFGKGVLENAYLKTININTEENPVLFEYYLKGSWGVY